MKQRLLLLAALAALAAAGQKPPRTRTDNVKETIHGVAIADPYRWLEDQNSPETRAWIDAQNRYTRPMLDAIPGRAGLKERLTALMKTEAIGMPRVYGGRYFFTKRAPEQDLSVLYVRKGLKGADQVLVDPHPLSADHTVSVNLSGISRDGALAAYSIRKGGADEVAVRFLNVDTRKELADQLPTARYSGISIKPDKTGFYYGLYRPGIGSRIYYHQFGGAADTKLFGDGYGPAVSIGSRLSDDGRYLMIGVSYGSSADRTEIWYQDVARGGPVVPIVKDVRARFQGEVAGDTLFIETNWNAPNGRVMTADLKNPARERWKEIVPENPKAVIGDVSAVGGRLCVTYLENVVSRVAVFTPDGRHVRDIAFPALGSVGGMSGRWDSAEAFYAFSSFHIPPTIYRYDIETGKQEVWSRLKVPVNSDDFEVKQVWYSSRDGTRVPMFLLHKKGLKLDGARPVYLTGYGGFNVSRTPGFAAPAVLWAEQGGVYALANLRGGSEFGESWHQAGMLAKKQNVFDDFIAAAEWLVKNNYTRPSRLAISGTSNGGLLVGAMLTQRPDLFGAVVCGYPLLDMIRYHKFFIASFWVPEYGSAENAEQFQWLYAYSPYQHVKPGGKYPAVLFVTGDSDTRVAPLHARKMAALLQASTGSDRPILLLYDTKSGHSGGRPLNKQIDERLDELSFLLWQLGALK